VEFRTEELPNGVTCVALVGRIDIDGAQIIDLPMNALAGSRRALVIDLAEVTYVASMGVRTLITCARASGAKGGRIAIANPQENVLKVLNTSGTHEIIPILGSLDEAMQAVVG
jgi:anti-anti-sigma factor